MEYGGVKKHADMFITVYVWEQEGGSTFLVIHLNIFNNRVSQKKQIGVSVQSFTVQNIREKNGVFALQGALSCPALP